MHMREEGSLDMEKRLSLEVEKNIKTVLNSKVFGSEISEFTGLQESQVSRMRNGVIDLKNIKFHTVKSLLDYYESDRFQSKLSKSYSEQ